MKAGKQRTQYVYGLHSVKALLSDDASTVRILWCRQGKPSPRVQALVELAQSAGISCQYIEKPQLDEKVQGGNHQGVVAECTAAMGKNKEIVDIPTLIKQLKDPACVLFLDNLQDPHNLGACLRTALAAGVDAVVASRERSVTLNATVRKVASGAADHVPYLEVTNLVRAMKQLQEAGLWVIGAESNAKQSIYEMDLKQSIVWVLGSEGDGLRRLTKESCDYLAYIPMSESIASLNVSVATGVCLFETVRQRSQQ